MKKNTARADYLATRPKEAMLQKTTIKTICSRVGTFRRDVENWGKMTVKLANDARAIGLFVLEFVNQLPGKELTLDFWHQFDGMFIDQLGHAVTREQLKMFVRIADNNPDEFTDVQLAMSWRQPLLLAAGFELVGERPSGTAHETNYYNRLFEVLDVKKINSVLDGLEANPNYGPMADWDADRRQRAWLQLAPTFKRIHEIESHLKPIEA